MPVSWTLLHKLLDSAEKMLIGYNLILVKALFICMWAFSMRICEFMHTGKRDPSHNIRAKAIRTSDVGLSVAFHLDKTSETLDCVLGQATPPPPEPQYY